MNFKKEMIDRVKYFIWEFHEEVEDHLICLPDGQTVCLLIDKNKGNFPPDFVKGIVDYMTSNYQTSESTHD